MEHEPDTPDPAFCNYCDVDFQPGDEVRRHHRGRYLHEVCFQERVRVDSLVRLRFYASEPEIWLPEPPVPDVESDHETGLPVFDGLVRDVFGGLGDRGSVTPGGLLVAGGVLGSIWLVSALSDLLRGLGAS